MDYVDDFEQDSGMESSPLYGNSSKDDTPERKPADDLELPKDNADVTELETETSKAQAEDSTETTKKTPEPEPDNSIKLMEGTVAHVQNPAQNSQENYDDEPDETLGERLWGLTEMFPDRLTNLTSSVASTTWFCVKNVYSFSRQATWIIATSSVILFAPIMFELERAKMDEMQKSQQKQFLLGPNAAMQLGAAGSPPPIPR